MRLGSEPVASTSPQSSFALIGICAAAFLSILDTSVTALVATSIRRDLGGSLEELAWLPNAYVLTYAVLIASAGVIGDRFGRRRLFVASMAAFGSGSLVCALAPMLGVLLLGRILQGAGTAGMLTMA